jgi:hypothetical protein
MAKRTDKQFSIKHYTEGKNRSGNMNPQKPGMNSGSSEG